MNQPLTVNPIVPTPGAREDYRPLVLDAIKPAQNTVELAGFSMITGAGLTAEKTAAAVNAGIDVFHQDTMVSHAYQPLTTAFLPEGVLPPLQANVQKHSPLPERLQRMLRLMTQPLQAITASLAKGTEITLFLALPEPLTLIKARWDSDFLALVAAQTGIAINRTTSRLINYGRAGGIIALNQAMLALQQNPDEPIVVGGVDTFRDLYHLSHLNAEERVLASGIMDGFVPGEAAAFIQLKPVTAGHSPTQKVILHPPGLGVEEGHRYHNDAPYKGHGLAQAITTALASCPAKGINHTHCSMNGESFSMKEWGVSAMRNSDSLDEAMMIHHPAEFFGDLGAAIGPVLIALAAIQLKQQAQTAHSLVWCSSELDSRAAVMLSTSISE